MLLLMGISLFTSRIVFKELGASDFGLYNVVAGFVSMLTFLNAAMSNATQRFLSFELAKNDSSKLKLVFSQIKLLHLCIAIFILIIGETIGVWFVNEILNIPSGRVFAANVVYQFSLLSTFLTVISIPYNSVIIAHENMRFYAAVGFVEGGLKILLCLILFVSFSDKLIVYAISVAVISIILRIVYWQYCKKYEETKGSYNKIDLPLLKEIGFFAVWNLCGSVATLGNLQGINILINIFFSTVVNAARGIAYQVDGIVRNFVQNFQTAVNPQLVKSFSIGDLQSMHSLIYMGSKISYFVLFVITMPIIFNLPLLLNFWLGEYPIDTVIFTRLVLVNSLVVSLSGILSMSALASGKIKNYQLTMGGILLLNLPIAYVLFLVGFPAYAVLIVSIAIEIILLFLRLLFLRSLIKLSFKLYFVRVIIPVFSTSVAVAIICYFINECFPPIGVSNFICSTTLYALSTSILVFLIGLNKSEKSKILSLVKTKVCQFMCYGKK